MLLTDISYRLVRHGSSADRLTLRHFERTDYYSDVAAVNLINEADS